jgi:hypothetical protein
VVEIVSDMYLFGQADGSITLFSIDPYVQKQVATFRPKQPYSAVIAMDLHPFSSQSGSSSTRNDLLVGREDTSVEVWVNAAPEDAEIPAFELRGKIELGESITGIKSADFEDRKEAIVTTYSGKIYGVYNDDDDSTLAGMEEVID